MLAFRVGDGLTEDQIYFAVRTCLKRTEGWGAVLIKKKKKADFFFFF